MKFPKKKRTYTGAIVEVINPKGLNEEQIEALFAKKGIRRVYARPGQAPGALIPVTLKSNGKGVGRDKIDWPFAIVQAFGYLKTSRASMAHLMGVSKRTIDREFELVDKGGWSDFVTAYERGLGSIKQDLVAHAVQMALTGDVAMLIFCLKNINGWADRVENQGHTEIKITIEDESKPEDKQAPEDETSGPRSSGGELPRFCQDLTKDPTARN